MKIEDVFGTPPFIVLGLGIARLLPERWSHVLARRIAHDLAGRRNHLFRTLRSNLAHAVAAGTRAEHLDALAERAVYHLLCAYMDMFRTSIRDFRRWPEQSRRIRVTPDSWAVTEGTLRAGRGTVLVGPHISNFDVLLQWITAQGIELQVLSLAQPNPGTRLINRLRARHGLTVTPISMPGLRQAIARLKRGGVVVTGVDRPTSDEGELIPFFGVAARLPVGHIRLALQTNARIIVVGAVQEADGHYLARFSAPIEMERSGNQTEDIRHNARRVLAIVEQFIRETPDQWLMLVPVWREGGDTS